MRPSNARILSSSPYSHHPKQDFLILSIFLKQKMPRKSNSIDFKRLGQVELAPRGTSGTISQDDPSISLAKENME